MPLKDIEEFEGTLPYASELFGVYKTLLGWKGLKTGERVIDERNNSIQLLVRSIFEYLKTAVLLPSLSGPGTLKIGFQSRGFESSWENVLRRVENVVIKFVDEKKHFPKTKEEWDELLRRAKQDLNRGT